MFFLNSPEVKKNIEISIFLCSRFYKLRRHLQPSQGDAEVIGAFRAVLLRELQRKIAPNINMRHKIGLMLWPKFASLESLPAEERAEVSFRIM